MEWQVFPTKTRRFTHTIGFTLSCNTNNGTWNVWFKVKHTEVRPAYGLRTHGNISSAQRNRLIEIGNKLNMRVHDWQNGMIDLIYDKPIPDCEFPTCIMKASVPTYEYNEGRPYYCVNHRS